MNHIIPPDLADEFTPPLDQPLFDAVIANDPAAVKARLDAGVTPDQVLGDAEGKTPLIRALEGGHHECLRLLLEADADVHLIDEEYRSPLRVALHKQDAIAVRMLLDHGADPYFLSVGKRPDGTEYDGPVTDIFIAAQGDPAISQMVKDAAQKFELCNLLYNTKVNQQNDLAAITGLLDSGVPVNIKHNNDRTALMYACIRRDAPLVKLLLDRGADPEITMRDGDTTALSFACSGSLPSPDATIVQMLLDAGANPKRVSRRRGMTLMHIAATGKDEETLKLLATQGLSLTVSNKEGNTPVQYAVEYGHKAEEIAPMFGRVVEWRRNQVDMMARDAVQLNKDLQPLKTLRFRNAPG